MTILASEVISVEHHNDRVMFMTVTKPDGFQYKAGQFVRFGIALKANPQNEDDFLKSLNMECVVEGFTKFNIPRVAQLSQRSNQFNFRTIRYSEDDIRKIENDKEHYAPEVQNIYDETPTYHDGKWLMFEPADTSLFEDFLRLLAIKRKPNRK